MGDSFKIVQSEFSRPVFIILIKVSIFLSIQFYVNYELLLEYRHFVDVKVTSEWIKHFPKYLIDKIDVENAAELYVFGDTNSIAELKERTAHFIQKYECNYTNLCNIYI